MRVRFYIYIIFGIFFLPVNIMAQGNWKDTNGNFINAHGAGILNYNGTYYMFGEIKKERRGWSRDKTGNVIVYQREVFHVIHQKICQHGNTKELP